MGIQSILQHRAGQRHGRARWEGRSYCRTSEALNRLSRKHAGPLRPDEVAQFGHAAGAARRAHAGKGDIVTNATTVTYGWVPSVLDIVVELRQSLDLGLDLLDALDCLDNKFPNTTEARLHRAFLVLIDAEGRRELIPQIDELQIFNRRHCKDYAAYVRAIARTQYSTHKREPGRAVSTSKPRQPAS